MQLNSYNQSSYYGSSFTGSSYYRPGITDTEPTPNPAGIGFTTNIGNIRFKIKSNLRDEQDVLDLAMLAVKSGILD